MLRTGIALIITAVFSIAAEMGTAYDHTSIVDIWVLDSLPGFDSSLVGIQGKPTLEVKLVDSSYLGNTGCNNYFGKIKLTDRNIQFLPAAMTKMYCSDNGLEHYFSMALMKSNRYERLQNQLYFYETDSLRCIFRKAD